MKVVVTKIAARQILRWSRNSLLAGSVLLLGYCGVIAVDAWTFQREERLQLQRRQYDQRSAAKSGNPTPSPTQSRPVLAGDLIGSIEIPRLRLSAIVVEGTEPSTLRRAVGHIPGTSLPGQPGNTGISGHRDTFFRLLRNIQPNDLVELTSAQGEYRYLVVSTQIVNPNDVSVLGAGANEVLTLVTCYPFYFVGPAPNRFVVHAERVTR